LSYIVVVVIVVVVVVDVVGVVVVVDLQYILQFDIRCAYDVITLFLFVCTANC